MLGEYSRLIGRAARIDGYSPWPTMRSGPLATRTVLRALYDQVQQSVGETREGLLRPLQNLRPIIIRSRHQSEVGPIFHIIYQTESVRAFLS